MVALHCEWKQTTVSELVSDSHASSDPLPGLCFQSLPMAHTFPACLWHRCWALPTTSGGFFHSSKGHTTQNQWGTLIAVKCPPSLDTLPKEPSSGPHLLSLLLAPIMGPDSNPRALQAQSHTSQNRGKPNLNNLQLLRCRPHRSEEQVQTIQSIKHRHLAIPKAKLTANSQLGQRYTTRSEVMLAIRNPCHKDWKTKEKTATKKQNRYPTKTKRQALKFTIPNPDGWTLV